MLRLLLRHVLLVLRPSHGGGCSCCCVAAEAVHVAC
jgi:hypothetical protein